MSIVACCIRNRTARSKAAAAVLLAGTLVGALAAAARGQAAPIVGGCAVFPPDNVWNVPVDDLPPHPMSDTWVGTIGGDRPLHPDFGAGQWQGQPIGIPYTTVGGDQRRVPIAFGYADESDPGPYPIPTDAPIEGGAGSSGDRHVLVVERGDCVLYELYAAYPQSDGSWRAGSGAVFPLDSYALRPAGWTSADAAGLPILAGLVRYDEVAAGRIDHAIRFTVPQTRREYVWPARHFASSLAGAEFPPMGQRFRLKSSVDIGGFPPQARVVLAALRRYGMILADNGSAWFISGAPDERWDNEDLATLRQVRGSWFEAVDVSGLMVDADSARVRGSAPATPEATVTAAPEATFTATPEATVTATREATVTVTPGAAATATTASPSEGSTVYLPAALALRTESPE